MYPGLMQFTRTPCGARNAAKTLVSCLTAALALQYGPEQGYGPLIDYLREKLDRDEGLGLARANLIITGGASQAIDHICTLFTQSGDIVLTETPSYSETLQLFRDHDLRPLQIPTDEGGLQVEALASARGCCT